MTNPQHVIVIDGNPAARRIRVEVLPRYLDGIHDVTVRSRRHARRWANSLHSLLGFPIEDTLPDAPIATPANRSLQP